MPEQVPLYLPIHLVTSTKYFMIPHRSQHIHYYTGVTVLELGDNKIIIFQSRLASYFRESLGGTYIDGPT